jgi:dTDP-4-amino-4,6-dideoxygalactose transaminase
MSVLSSGNYILGEYGQKLEKAIAEVCGCQYGIGVANGTDALELAVWALDIGPGDEVITPSFTFAATAEAIVLRGARPVFVDVDQATFNMNPSLIETAISENTKAIMPVHLYGLPAQMDTIISLAKKYYLKVIEDNAQAIGAFYKGQPAGSFGDLACISFYPTKNLAACGDAGMIVTNNAELSERLTRLRAHGMKKRYFHEELGVNSRLDEVQAAILFTKLPYLRGWNERRRGLAKLYNQVLSSIPWLRLPTSGTAGDDSNDPYNRVDHVWHQYTVIVDFDEKAGQSLLPANVMRDTIIQKLAQNGIGAMCYYPVPIHLQKAFAQFGYKKGDLPTTERLADRVLSLPMYPELKEESIEKIAVVLKKIGQELTTVPSIMVNTGSVQV